MDAGADAPLPLEGRGKGWGSFRVTGVAGIVRTSIAIEVFDGGAWRRDPDPLPLPTRGRGSSTPRSFDQRATP